MCIFFRFASEVLVHYGLIHSSDHQFHDTYQLLGPNMTNSIIARISRPLAEKVVHRSEVVFYLNPECRYAISIRPHIGEMFAQIVRYYYFMILPMMASITLYLIGHQLSVLGQEGRVPTCHSILWSQVSPVSVLFPARLVSTVLASVPFLTLVDDFTILKDLNLEYALITAIMYFISIGLTIAWIYFAFFCIIVLAQMFNKFLSKIISKVLPNNFLIDIMVDSVISNFSKFPKLLSAVLIGLSFLSCGTVALALGTLCHFMKMSKVYRNYMEWLIKKSVGIPQNKQFNEEIFEKLQLHLSFALLWTISFVLNLPSLLAWVHNISQGLYGPLYIGKVR